MSNVTELAMRRKVDKCLETVALILDGHRASSIKPADQVPHLYSDKYLLCDQLTNMTISSIVNSFPYLGIISEKLGNLKSWSENRSVSLRFFLETKCRFVKEIEREVEDPTRVQVQGVLFGTSSVRVITKVKEYIYDIEKNYEIKAFVGVGNVPGDAISLLHRSYKTQITTGSSSPPFPENSHDTSDENITWLLQQLDSTCLQARFSIDRKKSTCFTPRRNEDVTAALNCLMRLSGLLGKVQSCMSELHSFEVRYNKTPSTVLTHFTAENVLNPVVPLFEEGQHGGQAGGQGQQGLGEVAVVPAAGESSAPAALSPSAVSAIMSEQKRSLDAKCTEVRAMCDGSAQLAFTAQEAAVQVVVSHLHQVIEAHRMGVDYIEQMIRAQLVAAIGKEVSTRDFSQYMLFHNRKVFREAYAPRPFSYAVRRSVLHSPEGQVQIETSAVTPAEPIYTVSQVTQAGEASLMEFALNATSTVKFGGERHLHGWMAHRFSGEPMPSLRLVAQARQFSSYIVLIGRIASAKVFQPKYGFITQNKDEFSIPLELEQIPTAKEFKDAISSLSPEQQRFAKAFRSMQLESTLFAVCVIQIKPQLEKVLNLQPDSLTKEIKLTQELMQLFIKYQIPADLLSFDEQGYAMEPAASAAERVQAVKKNVEAMQGMLKAAKEEEVVEAKLKHDFALKSLNDNMDSILERSEIMDLCLMDQSTSLELNTASFTKKGKGGSWLMGGGGGGSFGGQMLMKSKKCSSNSITPGGAPPPPPLPTRRGGAPSQLSSTSSAPPPPTKSTAAAKTVSEDRATTEAPNQTFEPSQGVSDADNQLDYTKYPDRLEEMYTKYDPDSSLRPTIINPGSSWTKSAQAGLLASATTSTLGADEQKSEKDAAFDLLDALTRSGALPVEHASLHVIIAATHCFDESVMNTLVEKSVNPIERVERSTLIMAATLQGLPAMALVQDNQVDRLQQYSPSLLLEN